MFLRALFVFLLLSTQAAFAVPEQKTSQPIVGEAGLTPVAQAIPVSMHLPDPAMLPLVGAGAVLLFRRRRS